jgi:predicted porin
MKKSLIALAAMATIAAAGTASAQSTVTIYGRMDASVGSNKVDTTSTTQLFSGNLTTSRLGFRGTEDLGGGLKANFQLESALTVDDGTAAGLRFGRASWVGLSGGFGAVRLGLMDSPYKDIYDMGVSNNLYDSEFTPTKIAYLSGAVGTASGVSDFTSRPSNMVRYDSPSFGGFSGSVGYAFDENTAPVTTNSEITALNLRYRSGPLDVGLAYQDQKNATATLDRNFTVLAAAYNFGVVRVSGQYQITDQSNGLEDRDYSFGVTVPFGNVDVSAGFGSGKSELNGVTTGEGKAFALGATYALSKRTKLYGGLLDGDVENGAGATARERRLYAVGVRHDF